MALNLVTGATGHIGNTLVRQMIHEQRPLRAFVLACENPIALNDLDVEICCGDILVPETLQEAMQGVDVVYHLAGRIGLTSGPDPLTERVNREGTRNVIEAARKAKVRRLVYASSIYALHVPEKGLVDESLPFDPAHARGAYDRSKAEASLLVQQAAREGLETVIVCPTAVTGPYDFLKSEAGKGILFNMRPGVKFYLNGAYDFVDVRDVACGLILAAEKGMNGETYILGGERLSVRSMSELIWEAAGGWHAGVWVPDWLADLAASILPMVMKDPLISPYTLEAVRSNSEVSHEKAQRELDFHPRPASETIRDAVRWWQEHQERSLRVKKTADTAIAG